MSSENPQEAGLTIKAGLLSLIGIITMGSNFLNFNIEQGEIEGLIELTASFLVVLLTLFGLARKIYNTFKNFK